MRPALNFRLKAEATPWFLELFTFVFPAAPFRLELAGLALETFEGVQRLLAVVHPAHPAVDAGKDVVVGRGTRVGRDGAVQRRDGFIEFPLPLGRTALLE